MFITNSPPLFASGIFSAPVPWFILYIYFLLKASAQTIKLHRLNLSFWETHTIFCIISITIQWCLRRPPWRRLQCGLPRGRAAGPVPVVLHPGQEVQGPAQPSPALSEGPNFRSASALCGSSLPHSRGRLISLIFPRKFVYLNVNLSIQHIISSFGPGRTHFGEGGGGWGRCSSPRR